MTLYLSFVDSSFASLDILSMIDDKSVSAVRLIPLFVPQSGKILDRCSMTSSFWKRSNNVNVNVNVNTLSLNFNFN